MFGLLQIICILLFELIYMVVPEEVYLNYNFLHMSFKVRWLCILPNIIKRNFRSDMVDWIVDCELLLISQTT